MLDVSNLTSLNTNERKQQIILFRVKRITKLPQKIISGSESLQVCKIRYKDFLIVVVLELDSVRVAGKIIISLT